MQITIKFPETIASVEWSDEERIQEKQDRLARYVQTLASNLGLVGVSHLTIDFTGEPSSADYPV